MVEGSRDDLAAPPEAHRQRLIVLARQALERALLCDDAPVAVFVLEEEAHDRDPAVTLADGVLKAKARALRPPAETAGETAPRPLPLGPLALDDAPRHRPPAPRHPGRGRHPPRRRRRPRPSRPAPPPKARSTRWRCSRVPSAPLSPYATGCSPTPTPASWSSSTRHRRRTSPGRRRRPEPRLPSPSAAV